MRLRTTAWPAAILCAASTAMAAETVWEVGFAPPAKHFSKSEQECAQGFPGLLTLRGLDARGRGNVEAGSWGAPPEGATADRRLVWAGARLGNRLEMMVFRPGKDGRVRLVARQPALLNLHGSSTAPAGPSLGPGQDMRWGMAYLAALVAESLDSDRAAANGRPVAVTVETGPGASAEIAGELRWLSLGAASAAGLTPSVSEQPARLAVTFSKPGVAWNLQVVFSEKTERRAFECAHVPDDGLFVLLSAAMANVARWEGAVERMLFVSPAPDAILGRNGSSLVFTADRRVVSCDLSQGAPAWHTEPDTYRNRAYTSRFGPDGALKVYQYARNLEEISLKGGAPAPVARQTVPLPWGFQFDAGGRRLAVAAADGLTLYDKGRALWTYPAATRFQCGPLFLEDRLVVGEESGGLLCLAADGTARLLWRADARERLHGPIAHIPPPHGLLLAASQEGSLFAVSAAEGRVLWRADLGDRALGAPALVADAVVVASGSGGVRLLDVKTGAARKQWNPDAALRHFAVVPGSFGAIVGSDLSGTVTFLSGADLRVLRSVSLPAPLTFLAALPDPLGAKAADDLLGEARHLVVAADRSGVVYLMGAPDDAGRGP